MAYQIKKLEWLKSRLGNYGAYYLIWSDIPLIIGHIVENPDTEAYYLRIGFIIDNKWENATHPYPTPEAAMQKAQELYERYVKSFLVEAPCA